MTYPAAGILSAREQREKLARLGIRRNPLVVWWPKIGVGVFVVFALAAGAFVHLRATGVSGATGKDAATVVIAIGAFVIGFHQWGAARREASFERSYERLDRANDLLYKCAQARPLLHPAYRDSGQYLRDLYVCVELDNLEYAIEKYRIGYMSTRNAYRAMETFRSRCFHSREFRDLARRCAGDHVYNGETRLVVESILYDLSLEHSRDQGVSRWMRRRDNPRSRAALSNRRRQVADSR